MTALCSPGAARRVLAALLFALCCALPGAAGAQERWDAGLQPTRAEMDARAARYEAAARAPESTAQVREIATREAERIRVRLRDGDFQEGDRVALVVENEEALSDTFAVGQGRTLALPGVGTLQLAGILRSELNAHVDNFLRRYMRDPVVRSRSLIRIAVTGQVARPGFFLLPAEAPLADALMAAGGPLPTAKLAHARVERVGTRIWEGAFLRHAIASGQTLDQMSLRAGDEIVVPAEGSGRGAAALRAAAVIPATLLAIAGFLR